MKLVLFGPPGAGKGTQAEILSKYYDIPTISTGAIIRNCIRNQDQVGIEAKKYIDGGLLVPDDMVFDIVSKRLAADDCKNGYILDGFPRTLNQAKSMEDMGIVVDKVLSIELADDVILERLSGRRECLRCHSTYHTGYKPPKKSGVCDKCAGNLIRRPDDMPQTIMTRLQVYHKQTESIKQYYKERGLLVTAFSREEVSDTTAGVFEALGERLNDNN